MKSLILLALAILPTIATVQIFTRAVSVMHQMAAIQMAQISVILIAASVIAYGTKPKNKKDQTP